MKRFKISILAFVALLAMSFTLVSFEGNDKKRVVGDENDCFLPTLVVKKNALVGNCTDIPDVTTSLNCPLGQDYNNAHIMSFDETQFIDVLDIEEQCPDPQNIVCCIRVTPDLSPCTDQAQKNLNTGTFKRYKILSIRCEEE